MAYVNFVCPRCGWEQARHHNARLCLGEKCSGKLIRRDSGVLPKIIQKALELEAQRQVLCRERDKFRDLLADWDAIYDSWEAALEDFEEVSRALHDVVDQLSEHV